jgi:hypothetical protein
VSEVTRILNAIEEGDTGATDRLLPLVYEELRLLAAQKLSHESPGQTLQATGMRDYAANTVIDFTGVAAQFVRLTVNSGYGTYGQYGLSEVRFSYIPTRSSHPQPADGATDVDPDGVLTWRAGREAVSHEVYLSTDKQAVLDGTALIDTVATSSYQPGVLDPGQVYYWKITEVNETETPGRWEGDVWQFTTNE